jgi:hypothetical protein
MTHRTACLLAGATFLFACSDGTGPSSGTFRAQLSGAHVATLSGPSNARAFATEESPDPRFAISMFAFQGDTIRSLSVSCPGQEPPEPGTYSVGESESACHGSYVRLLSTPENGTIILSGTLIVGESPAGVMGATGSFSATTVP